MLQSENVKIKILKMTSILNMLFWIWTRDLTPEVNFCIYIIIQLEENQ